MIHRRTSSSPSPATGNAWLDTCPSPLTELAPRLQPPLKEVLKGLETRELEGPTVFDQWFGPTAPR